ncbi:hypothetical protein M0638_02975, partial [Roseomonas sp. NAR14]|nr:hypothetical protein [Roseomonas acroporae]
MATRARIVVATLAARFGAGIALAVARRLGGRAAAAGLAVAGVARFRATGVARFRATGVAGLAAGAVPARVAGGALVASRRTRGLLAAGPLRILAAAFLVAPLDARPGLCGTGFRRTGLGRAVVARAVLVPAATLTARLAPAAACLGPFLGASATAAAAGAAGG